MCDLGYRRRAYRPERLDRGTKKAECPPPATVSAHASGRLAVDVPSSAVADSIRPGRVMSTPP
jgi:hypothetical protein